MKISTRGRYALRVIIDLAEHKNSNFIPLKDIVDRQEISQKYLEGIMTDLAKAGMLDAQHGKGGGYKLNRDPENITVFEILEITEGELAPVSCLEKNAKPCSRVAECRTLPMWQKFYDTVREFFNGITIADLTKSTPNVDNYII